METRWMATLFCLSLILLLGPAFTAVASAHPSAQSSSTFSLTTPQAVNAVVPRGFTPSDNRPQTLPIESNTTSRVVGASGLNDGYCFLGNGSCGQVTYHGGPIMHNALAVIVLWAGCGSNGCLSCSTGYFDNATIDPTASNPNDCTYGSLQYDYLRDFCTAGNPLLRVIDQYTDKSGAALNSCSIYGGKWYYAYNPFPEKPLTDDDIQTEAMAVLNGFGLNASTNTEVFIFTPYGVSSCAGTNDCFPTGSFCAYHNWFWSGTPYLSPQVVYSSMPDTGWAGADCGLGGPSPNHDPFADNEVSPLFHEAVESFTDPTPGYIYGDGWYYDGYQEIADQCAYDFVGTQPSDGSNVRLGLPGTVGDPYRIQAVWSNANEGCTLDLKGPPTLVQETLDQDVSTGTPASAQEFPIHYQEAGETGAFASVNSTCCGVATGFYATLGSLFTTSPVLGSNERWCFDDSCSNRTSYALGFTALEFYYFDLLRQSASYEVSGGGSVPPPKLSYETAPSGETPGDSPAAESLLLSNIVQDFWSLRGSTITTPLMFTSGTAERWVAKQATWVATTPDAVPPIVYYHQYSLNFSYSVVDGGAPIPPSLKFLQLGASQDLFLGTTPATYWVDSDTSYQANQVLSSSTSTERWIAGQTSGLASASEAVTFVYYHQYCVNTSYSVIDGGVPPAPSFNFDIMGKPSSYPLSQVPTSTWMDASSWSVPNALAGLSSAGERWAAAGKTNGTVSSDAPIAIAYYHQFEFDLEYSVSDNSTSAAPRLISESFGHGFSSPLGTSASVFWFDDGANWSLDRLLSGSGALERWITNGPTGGVVSAPLTTSLEYFHEFYVTIQTAQTAGGSVAPTGWYNATDTLVLTANANDGWQFERWDGRGLGNYSGAAEFVAVTIRSPIVENATFYPSLVLVNPGLGRITYQWGVNQGSLLSGAPLYVPIGTNVTLTATPTSPLFAFNGYSGALISGRSVSSVLVDGPTEVKASFSLSYNLLFALFGGIGLGGAALVYYLRRTSSSMSRRP